MKGLIFGTVYASVLCPIFCCKPELLEIGNPSITYKGSFPAEIDAEPLILITGAEPGSPDGTETSKPATLP